MSLNSNALITVDEYRLHKSVGEDDNNFDEAMYERWINSASQHFEDACARKFITPSADINETFNGGGNKDHRVANGRIVDSSSPTLNVWNAGSKVFENIVTTYATTGSGYVVPSAIAKAGVQTMTKSLAVEWAKYGITMNAIAPGPFPTEGAWDRLLPPGLEAKFIDRIPLKRVGEHIELANLAVYLVSDQSQYINGEVITIDGGEWLKGAGEFNFLDVLEEVLE